MMDWRKHLHLRGGITAALSTVAEAQIRSAGASTMKEPHMIRARLASVTLAAGLGLVCGCLNLSERPLLHPFRTIAGWLLRGRLLRRGRGRTAARRRTGHAAGAPTAGHDRADAAAAPRADAASAARPVCAQRTVRGLD